MHCMCILKYQVDAQCRGNVLLFNGSLCISVNINQNKREKKNKKLTQRQRSFRMSFIKESMQLNFRSVVSCCYEIN